MSALAAKSPKKRKSLSNLGNTPSKAPKVEKVQTPKNAKIPKTDITPSNGKQSDNQGKGINNKNAKVKTPVKKNENVSNGTKKLEKFKGTKSLKTSTKRQLFIQKLKEQSEKEGQEVVAKLLNEKIAAITSRSEITKSARKKQKDLKQLLKLITGVSSPSVQVQTKKTQESKKSKKAKSADSKSNDKPVKIEKKKKVEPVITEEDEEDSEAENEDESIDDAESDDGGDSDDDGEDSDDDDDEDEAADDEPAEKNLKKVIQSKAKTETEEKSSPTKNSRYVLFVGNIAYDTTREELQDHFKRVGAITDIRIPLHKETNKPRGFAYVELPNEASYQKALDLNGSQLKSRKIHVEYTQGGKKKNEDSKKEIKAKNFKLHAMRKQGQFGKGNKPSFKGKGKPAK